MPISRTSYWKNPNIGLFFYTDNEVTLVPEDIHPKLTPAFGALGTEVLEISISGSPLMGIYAAGNTKGILLPDLLYKDEQQIMKRTKKEICYSKSKFNAFGNNIVVNDKGCIASKHYSPDQEKQFSDLFGCETVRMNLAGYTAVGALCCANNKGAVVSSKLSDAEIALVESVLKVPATIGSVNFGSPFLHMGIVANDKGLVVGEGCSGFEIGNIQGALGIE
ncbi:translation initiation factor IF-6 [Candidatus Micrarchaeota archaeon CG08_land_8_20_14_0_20_49_17]|nr:MAG: hypothetical protein AUJ13_03145 [Candidatus Micrarchaeota archaeon CG1_02_49_24]PIU10278.1 MAG: translation initiation factor IF-6 [Candidatus Micrarchaeota archaeon CG08_land_8_20_14_0_20_49_17]PIZ99389.1 MAG: translation initiation factor IF-6 [Candidatus Micrarchaeota archaeon CG_4_10_14_0_2_um_filter_49_7]